MPAAATLAIALLALGACARPKPPTLSNWEAYGGVIVPAPLVPVEAAGSVQFNYRGRKESGQVLLLGNPEQDYTVRVSARLLGTAALEVRFGHGMLMVLDYGAETYFLGPNDAETQRKLFDLDLAPADFSMLLTARIPHALYAGGGGHEAEPGAVEFEYAEATYRFELDPAGLPRQWSRIERGTATLRVEYREYQDVPAGTGTIRLPRKIRVYAGEPEPRMVLGVSEFRLGSDADAPAQVAFEPPPGLRFQGLEEVPSVR